MKNILILIILLCFSCDNAVNEYSKEYQDKYKEIKKELFDITENLISYNWLSKIEKDMIKEINFLRTNPIEYVKNYVIPYRDENITINKDLVDKVINPLHDRLLSIKNDYNKDYDDLYPLKPLVPIKGLTVSIRDHILDLNRNDYISTTVGSETVKKRASHYTKDESDDFNDIIKIGFHSVFRDNLKNNKYNNVSFILYLLLDNQDNFKYREALLDPDYRYIGLAIGIGTSLLYEKKGAMYLILSKAYPGDRIEITKDIDWIHPSIRDWIIPANHDPIDL